MEKLNEKDVENITKTVASFDELALTSKGFMEKLDEIERNLNYKRFYFPGANVRLYVEGEGKDTKDVHYISSVQSTEWDPRFLTEYVNKARNEGYEKHVIYYSPFSENWETKDYGEIWQILKDYYDPIDNDLKNLASLSVVEQTKNKDAISSAIASLEYFDKMDDFINFSEIKYMKAIQGKYSSRIKFFKDKIKSDLTRKSEADFKRLDYGFFAPKQLAFDAEKEIAEYEKYQKEYEDYKAKLWEMLKGISNLQLCASSISGIQQASGSAKITMNQYISCINEAREAITPETPEETTVPEEVDVPVDVESTDVERQEPGNSTRKIIIVVIVVASVLLLLILGTALVLYTANNTPNSEYRSSRQ